jgi:transportin-3
VPAEQHVAVRTQLLELLKIYAPGPKPIRVQLCVCLAILAIQMKEWKNVLPLVVSSLGNQAESHAAILDFLRILPEEVTEGRKITLSVCGMRNTKTSHACLPVGGGSWRYNEPWVTV